MRKFYALNILIVLLFLKGSLLSQTKIIPYQELPAANGALSGSGVFFGATMSVSSVTVTFAGPSDRWIALGLGTGMYPTDVLIYSNGKLGATHPLGWNDYYNSSGGSFGVNNDVTQNWTILSTGTVSPGQRTVTASRVLNTGDLNDVPFIFANSALDVVWAFGATADYTIAYHGSNNRAYWISLPWLSAPTASFVSSTTVCTGAAMVYTNASTGGQTTYTWNFSGGTPAVSTATNPSVTYSTPGTYSVSLTASNAIGSNTYTQINYITVTPTVAPLINIGLSAGSNPMCASAPVTFTAAVVNGGANPSFQWRVGGTNVGTNNATFNTTSLTGPANIICVLTSNAVCANPTTYTSAVISMTVNSTAPASVAVSQVSGSNPMCIGAVAGFTAIPANGGTNPAYQWQVNNLNAGSNSPSFTTSTLANGDIVSCILSSNAPCASSTTGISAGITITVSSVLAPVISINSISNPLCAGQSATINAIPLNGGNAPVYQWRVNGVNTGTGTPVFITNGLVNGDVVSCQMTSALQCASPSTVLSSGITFTVNPIPPTPTISASGSLSLCAGNSLTLTSSAATGNVWSDNTTLQSVVAVNTSSYFVTQVVNGCNSAGSAVVHVTLYPLPTVTFSPVSPVCKDAPAFTLSALPAGGTYTGSGVVGNLFDPSTANTGSNIIIYTYTDNNNCKNTASIGMVVDECLGLTDIVKQRTQAIAYPNPGKGLFVVESKAGKIIDIQVIDAAGKCVRSYKALNSTTASVDISTYANGLYVVELKMETQILKLRVSKTD